MSWWRKRKESSLGKIGDRYGRINAVRQNSFPMTEARSAATRSSAGSCSSRVASSAWIVGGTATSPPRPSCAISASICSTNNGLPSAVSEIRSRMESDRLAPPSRLSISTSDSSSESDSSNGGVAAPIGEMVDEVEERLLGPVQVVQHEDQRSVSRESLEEAPHGVKRVLA